MRPIVNVPRENRATDIGNVHKNLVKVARVVPGVSSQTDRQTNRQTYSSQYFATAPASEVIGRETEKTKTDIPRRNGPVKGPWSQSWRRKRVFGRNDLWNRLIVSREWKTDQVMDEGSGELTEEELTGAGKGDDWRVRYRELADTRLSEGNGVDSREKVKHVERNDQLVYS